jgi:hypothetical protein
VLFAAEGSIPHYLDPIAAVCVTLENIMMTSKIQVSMTVIWIAWTVFQTRTLISLVQSLVVRVLQGRPLRPVLRYVEFAKLDTSVLSVRIQPHVPQESTVMEVEIVRVAKLVINVPAAWTTLNAALASTKVRLNNRLASNAKLVAINRALLKRLALIV